MSWFFFVLDCYYVKCDFSIMFELFGYVQFVWWQGKQVLLEGLQFFIQCYYVCWLYYDFWLEFDGVFKSWVVFKGLSLDLCDKWFVVWVEDYFFDYGMFEGDILVYQYGVGYVVLWDCG